MFLKYWREINDTVTCLTRKFMMYRKRNFKYEKVPVTAPSGVQNEMELERHKNMKC